MNVLLSRLELRVAGREGEIPTSSREIYRVAKPGRAHIPGEKVRSSSRSIQLRILPLGGKRLAIYTANTARERSSECCGE
jgi:hypothetical protein